MMVAQSVLAGLSIWLVGSLTLLPQVACVHFGEQDSSDFVSESEEKQAKLSSGVHHVANTSSGTIAHAIESWCHHSVRVLEGARVFRKVPEGDAAGYMSELDKIKTHIDKLNSAQFEELQGKDALSALSTMYLNKLIKDFRESPIETYVKTIKSTKAANPSFRIGEISKSFIRHGEGQNIPLVWFKLQIDRGVEEKADLRELLQGMNINLGEVLALALDTAAAARTSRSYEAMMSGAFLNYQQDSEEIDSEAKAIQVKKEETCTEGDLQCFGDFVQNVIETKILGPIAEFFDWGSSLLEEEARDSFNASRSLALVGYPSVRELKKKMKSAAAYGVQFVMESPRVTAYVHQNLQKNPLSALRAVGVWITFYLLPALLKSAFVIVAGAGAAVIALGVAIVAAPFWLASLIGR